MTDYIITIRVNEQFWKNIMHEIVLDSRIEKILDCHKERDNNNDR